MTQKAYYTVLDAFCILHAETDAGAGYRAGKHIGDKIPAGWPDITACRPGGQFWGIECKSAKGRQSAAQRAMQAKIEQDGGLYTLARGVDDVMKVIEGSRT